MIRFETKVCRNWYGRPKLVICSSHVASNGVLSNMLSSTYGEPMLDVADAIELRAILDKFIKEESK